MTAINLNYLISTEKISEYESRTFVAKIKGKKGDTGIQDNKYGL